MALADIVRRRKPYAPAAGILAQLPDGRVRNVSTCLYDAQRRELLMDPNSIPEFVDFHSGEFELYKRAAEPGYLPLVP